MSVIHPDPRLEHPAVLVSRGPVIAMYKPSGMPTYDASPDGSGPPDALSWAREHLGDPDLMPIHRLDAETSGVVLFSGDPATRAQLGRAFAEGTVAKTYVALVHGRTRAKGTIRTPLVDARRGAPLPAVTRYRARAWFGQFTFVELAPSTGRKHQLRRHLAGIGHPIVGDLRYGGRKFRAVPHAELWGGRLWLHAARIAFPGGLVYEALLPDALKRHLEVMEETAEGLGA